MKYLLLSTMALVLCACGSSDKNWSSNHSSSDNDDYILKNTGRTVASIKNCSLVKQSKGNLYQVQVNKEPYSPYLYKYTDARNLLEKLYSKGKCH